MKILAIGAHFDDVELGCGGSLLQWKKEGNELFVFVATQSGYTAPDGSIIRTNEIAKEEGIKAAKYMDAVLLEGKFPTFDLAFDENLNSKLKEVIETIQPDIILTHWLHDTHHDHHILAQATLHCARNVPKLLLYRSNWYEGLHTFHPKYFKNINQTLEAKINLIKLHHSEFSRTKGNWEKFIRSEAQLQGLKAGLEFAEAFEIVKWVEL